ncbi:hypothetical protein PRZ48_011598 [Zasmidium cellare]|uniref:Uncharacterized protein n=1 Tax=Zasmidium cellare TaxID=395010 RepID=A0ABR0E6T1_ZASCE|nr:hypothetical protein PRZ48_011598 [Zasmidium cellare]
MGKKKKEKEKAFRLMDLPAEIRCLIYEYLLRGKCPVQVISGYTKKNSRARAMLRKGCEPGISAAILHVNKQIYNESAPILYGSNTFIGGSPQHASFFVRSIGGQIRFVQHIGFEYHWKIKIYLKQLVQSLKSAKRLQTLELPINIAAYYYRPATLVAELLPLFKLLRDSQRSVSGKTPRAISHILAKRPYTPPWDPILYARDDACWAETKALLAKALGEDVVGA